MPRRNFKDAAEFKAYLQEEKEIIVDVSEQATQRPKNQEAQKEQYSGKKKRPTHKELIISTKNKQILYISQSYKGKQPDYSLLQAEFPPDQDWFTRVKVRLDLGFQGFADLYQCEQLCIPIKKKRTPKGVCNELTAQQKEHNKQAGQERIYVEHAIGGMKRYRILEHRSRIKSRKIINQIIGVCAALWNFYLLNL